MKKVLFILGNFYPESSANGICAMEIMEQLLARGCVVHCIANKGDDLSEHEIIDGVQVHRCRNLLSNKLQKKYKNAKNPLYAMALRVALKVKNFYVWLISAINFPYVSVKFINRMVRKAKEIVREEGIDTVICVSQPTTTLYAGQRLKKNGDIQCVAYLLDPIINGSSHPMVCAGRRERVLQALQNKVLKNFDLVVGQNEHRKLFESVMNTAQAEKLHFLGAPLLTEKRVPPVKQTDGKKTVIYAGGLSDSRSPAFVAEAFQYVQSATLHIYSANQSRWLKDILGNNPNVVLHPPIDRVQLMSIMKGADGLLSIGNTQSEYAPSKIIECISFGKPLITTYRTDDDTCRPYMEKYPLGLYLDERAMTAEEAASRIDAVLSQSRAEIPFAELEKRYWDNTPGAFVDLVKKYR